MHNEEIRIFTAHRYCFLAQLWARKDVFEIFELLMGISDRSEQVRLLPFAGSELPDRYFWPQLNQHGNPGGMNIIIATATNALDEHGESYNFTCNLCVSGLSAAELRERVDRALKSLPEKRGWFPIYVNRADSYPTAQRCLAAWKEKPASR